MAARRKVARATPEAAEAREAARLDNKSYPQLCPHKHAPYRVVGKRRVRDVPTGCIVYLCPREGATGALVQAGHVQRVETYEPRPKAPEVPPETEG